MHPTLAAVREHNQPVGSIPLQQLDFIALIDDANLRRPQFIGRVQQTHQAVADQASFVVFQRPNARRGKGEVRSIGVGAQRILFSDLLQ